MGLSGHNVLYLSGLLQKELSGPHMIVALNYINLYGGATMINFQIIRVISLSFFSRLSISPVLFVLCMRVIVIEFQYRRCWCHFFYLWNWVFHVSYSR